MGTKPKYIRWLFDSKEAFEKTINDPRYHYDMLHSQFMAIYNQHRNGTVNEVESSTSFPDFSSNQTFSKPEVQEKPAEASQILTQAEIDALISMASG